MKIDDVLESQRGPARLFLMVLLFLWNYLLLFAVLSLRLSMGLLVLSLLVQGLLYSLGKRLGSPRRGAFVALAGAVLGLWWFGSYSVAPASPAATPAVFCISVAALTLGLLEFIKRRSDEPVSPTVTPSHALVRESLWVLGTAAAMMFVLWVPFLLTAAILFVTGLPKEVLASDSVPLHVRVAIAGSNIAVRLFPFAVILALAQRRGRFLHRRLRTPSGTVLSNTEAGLGAALVLVVSAIVSLVLQDFRRADAEGVTGALVVGFAAAAWVWLGHLLARAVAFGDRTDEEAERTYTSQVTMEPTSLNRLVGEFQGKQVAFWVSRWSGMETLAIDGREVSRKRSFGFCPTHELSDNELGVTKAIVSKFPFRLELYRGVEKLATLANPREFLTRRIAIATMVPVLFIAALQWNEPRTVPIAVSSIRVISLQAAGDTWQAEVGSAGTGATLTLRAGDLLSDGVVKSVSKDHIMVEWAPPRNVSTGAEAPKLLLRFSPPQPLPALTLGRDTTWITSPLLADGGPDYGAWLNEKYGAGVTPENNAAEPIKAALAGLVDAGQTFWDGIPFEGGSWSQKLLQPWSEKGCPRCVARLKLNEKAMAALAEATRRPRYFVPFPAQTRISQVRLESALNFRIAVNALSGRGMLQVGRGDLDGAIADTLTAQRLAISLDQAPFLIHRLIAVAVRSIIAPLLPAIASAPSLSAPQARSFLRQLTELRATPSLAEVFDLGERAYPLDRVLVRRARVSERGAGGMAVEEDEGVDWSFDPFVKIRYALSAATLDWDEALRDANREIDVNLAFFGASAAERRLNRATLQAAEERRRNQIASLKTDLRSHIRGEATEGEDMAVAAEEIARTPEGRKRLVVLLPDNGPYARAQLSWNEGETLFRIGVMTVALAAHRLATGHFPLTLTEMGADLLPDRLAPSTPLPGYTLSYTRGPGSGADTPGTYAMIAVPEEHSVTGVRAFCVDSTGVMRFNLDGTAPKLVNGVCDPALERTRG